MEKLDRTGGLQHKTVSVFESSPSEDEPSRSCSLFKSSLSEENGSEKNPLFYSSSSDNESMCVDNEEDKGGNPYPILGKDTTQDDYKEALRVRSLDFCAEKRH